MPIDYKRFLGTSESVVLPWLEGHSVDAPTRRLRCPAPPTRPGWYEFSVEGRVATLRAPSQPPDDFTTLPAIRGPLIQFDGRSCIVEHGQLMPLWFLGEGDEPAMFAPVLARRWATQHVICDQLEFEGETEELARRAFETGEGLQSVFGASASLRLAYAFATLQQVSRRIGIPVSHREARQQARTVIDGGAAGAEQFLRALERERAVIAEELRLLGAQRAARAHRETLDAVRSQREDATERLELVLEGTGATLLRSRRVGDDALEVVFRFMAERFVAVIHARTLQVLDAGICLGHPPADEELTLESLPAVIREAIETDALVITRHA